MKNLFYSLIISCLIMNSQAFASKESDVLQFSSYLQKIKSVAIDFTQEDSLGNKAEGKLLIAKPHKFRCNYYSPFPIIIIGNKNYVSVYDYDMKHVTRIKASENIFNFLLEDTQDFKKNFDIKSITDKGKFFKITLYHKPSERSSEVTFDKATKLIYMIKIFEDDNIITITFTHITNIQKFDDSLFQLKNPEIFGVPERLDRNMIEKKYIVSGK